MHRNKSVSSHQFAMVPKAEILALVLTRNMLTKLLLMVVILYLSTVMKFFPEICTMLRQQCLLVWQRHCFLLWIICILIRFFFFVPNRLVWTNWVKFMGEQTNPGDSTSYVVPTITSPCGRLCRWFSI